MSSCREIENLLYLYAERIDGGDFEGVAEMLADAVVTSPAHDDGVTGYDAILAMFKASTRLYEETGTPCTKHLMSNAIIDVDDSSGRAEVRSQFTVFQGVPGFAFQPIVAGRYHDQFGRADNHWRFSRREMLIDFVGDVSHHLLFEL